MTEHDASRADAPPVFQTSLVIAESEFQIVSRLHTAKGRKNTYRTRHVIKKNRNIVAEKFNGEYIMKHFRVYQH